MHSGIESWMNLVTYAFNAFSTPLLTKTLISPLENDSGAGPQFTFFERFVFAVVIRLVGFVSRLAFIIIGLAFTILAILTFPIFLLIPIKISRKYFTDLPSFGAFLSYGNTPLLNKYGHDIYTPPSLVLYGKEKILRMIERGLSKNTNRNVLLVGETGTGKSTVISYLGHLGHSGLSFPGIRYHRVVELALDTLSEEDFNKTMSEVARAGNVMVVLENIHKYPDLFDSLLAYLKMSSLGILATTDLTNYDQVLKRYPEFLSKFEKVDLEETSDDETVAILKNQVHLEKISIDDDAIHEIVRLSERFIDNQSQPLKSILVLEELRSLGRHISVKDVRQIVSDKTNIPIGPLAVEERKVLTKLEEKIKEKIIGQDEAANEVAEAFKRLRAGVSDPSKSAASFIFLGPTGVGKTYTAKILAESYFGNQNAMVRFDMSEFSLPGSVNLFSDRLASVIEERPLSLVFLDELEKSNRAIHNLLLQVLDEGHLTRESGRRVSFKDAIIIATSNAGSSQILNDPNINKKTLVDYLIEQGLFAPEFLNRFSDIILFKRLSTENIKKITRLLLADFAERLLADKKIKLVITDALVEKIASAGFDEKFGARPIKRAIEEIVENKVADYIVAGNDGGEIKIL